MFSGLIDRLNKINFSYSDLYHYTNSSSVIKILDSGFINNGQDNYISCTRNINYQICKSQKVILVLDRNKISTRYKIKPTDWFYNNKTERIYKSRADGISEFEETILTNKLSIKYIKKIIFCDVVIPKSLENKCKKLNITIELLDNKQNNLINNLTKFRTNNYLTMNSEKYNLIKTCPINIKYEMQGQQLLCTLDYNDYSSFKQWCTENNIEYTYYGYNMKNKQCSVLLDLYG